MKFRTLASAALLTMTACAPADQAPEDPMVGRTGINLRSDILADTDVTGMGYTITPVDCDSGEPNDPEGVIVTARDLEDIMLPGGHPGFEDQPFDAASGHLFADNFQALAAGCYAVVAQPLGAEGAASEDCAPASAPNVEVLDGEVTEILLVSQCDGDGIGALDAIVALNHAPEIIDVYYEPSKFTCGDRTAICVVAHDPDNDPIVLEGIGGEGVEVAPREPAVDEDGNTVYCADVVVPGPGEHAVELIVRDLMHDAEGRLVPVETLLEDGQTSRGTLTVPVHAMEAEACICECPDGFALNAAGDACERFAEADPEFNGEARPVCEGDRLAEFGALGAAFPGGLRVQNAFFGENFDDMNGRLNEVGIWTCGASPLDEWIGFSACIQVEEAGEYVMGISGDDEVRVVVDGVQVFRNPADEPTYRTWWMVPVTLTPGEHVIEMEGIDYRVAATLGAEIYGPFPAGSTADDATMADLDYAGNTIWTTRDMLGGVFHTGANAGYSCPDGTSLNLCGEAPTCTGFQQLACE